MAKPYIKLLCCIFVFSCLTIFSFAYSVKRNFLKPVQAVVFRCGSIAQLQIYPALDLCNSLSLSHTHNVIVLVIKKPTIHEKLEQNEGKTKLLH